MDTDEHPTIAVIGGGLCGALTAITLGQRGYNVTLYESRPDWRVSKEAADLKAGEDKTKSAIKRSINLALSHRGQKALEEAGVLDEVMKTAIPMRCRAIHSMKSNTAGEADVFQPYDEVDSSNAIYSVSREGLNNLLLDKAEALSTVKVVFGYKLSHISPDGTAHFVDFQKNPPSSSPATYNDYYAGDMKVKPSLIIGADGAYSSVREAMLRLLPMNFSREYITHGYKELTLPPNPKTKDFAMKNHEALHIWPRGQFMLIGLPNPDKTFTCTLFAPFHTTTENGVEVPGMEDQKTDEEIKAYFEKYFPDAVPLMPDYIEEYKRNPACRLVMVKTSPWNYKDKVLILGDAAHAMVPFYGQGMNSGFEDVLVFLETLQACDGVLSNAVQTFAANRRPQGEAIVQLSLRNYTEMRDHTASTIFLIRKKFEGVLNRLLPNYWIPLYKMVAFTRIPYREAISRSEAQDRILQRASLVTIAGTIAVASYGLFRLFKK